MLQHIGHIALLVRDYDEAISYFVAKLGFTVAEDTDLGGGKRWVLVAPPGSVETGLYWQRPSLRTNWLAGIRLVPRLPVFAHGRFLARLPCLHSSLKGRPKRRVSSFIRSGNLLRWGMTPPNRHLIEGKPREREKCINDQSIATSSERGAEPCTVRTSREFES
jgi:catechol 2,3-dioxygenase-like lactoylglutathione lyase family enzyme